MITESISVIPPQVIESFSKVMLSAAMPGWKEPGHYLNVYGSLAKQKYKEGSRKMREFEELLRVYGEIYKWKKAEEAFRGKKEEEQVERPAIPTEEIYRIRGDLGRVLRESFKLARKTH